MRRGFLGLLVAVVLSVVCAVPSAFADTPTPPWSGSGTSADPFKIANADDLRTLAAQTNSNYYWRGCCFELTQDIDLNNQAFTPIGLGGSAEKDAAMYPFSGTFDGKGHTIKGLNVSEGFHAGLFGYTSLWFNPSALDDSYTGSEGLYPAVIKDFTVEGTVNCTYSYAAGVVANATRDTTVSGVTSKVNVTAAGMSVGGIVGSMEVQGEGSKLTVLNCVNEGAITGGAYGVGGILGNIGYSGSFDGADYSQVVGCANKGAVKSTNTVGGIVGDVNLRSGYKGMAIANCIDTGSVTATSASADSGAYGIVSGFATDTAGNMVISNCYSVTGLAPYDPSKASKASITSVDTKAASELTDVFLATLRGNAVPEPRTATVVDDTPDVTTITSAAEWKAFADEVNKGRTYAGKTVKLGADIDLTSMAGLKPVGSLSDISTLSGSSFRGTFDGQNHTVTVVMTGAGSTGLFGFVTGSEYGGVGTALIKDLTVKGAITSSAADRNVGGVVGTLGRATLSNVKSEVNISSPSAIPETCVGGLVGLSISSAAMSGCSYKGTLSAQNAGRVGGLVGSFRYFDSREPKLTNCTVNGSVGGYTATGGFVGWCGAANDFTAGFALNLENCTLDATVTGTEKTGVLLGEMKRPYSGESSLVMPGTTYNAAKAGNLPLVGAGIGDGGIDQGERFTVTFDTAGGSEVASVMVKPNTPVAKPSPDPVKEGYLFDQWKLAGAEYDFSSAVTGNITLAAAWKVDYTLLEDALSAAKAERDKAQEGALGAGAVQLVADNAQASDVAAGVPYVTKSQQSALASAIEAADSALEAARANTAKKTDEALVADLAEARRAIEAATGTFKAAYADQVGTKKSEGGADAGQTGADALEKTPIADAQVTVGQLVYTGRALTPVVTVALGGETITEGIAFSYLDSSSKPIDASKVKGAGTYYVVVSALDTGRYTGSTGAVKFTVGKASQKVSAKGFKRTVSASAKSAKINVKKLAKVSAKTAVSFTGKANKQAKSFKIAKKTGKITVKAGTKPGTYKFKVKATAAKSSNYKASPVKKFTVTIVVK